MVLSKDGPSGKILNTKSKARAPVIVFFGHYKLDRKKTYI